MDHRGFLPQAAERRDFLAACARPPRTAIRVNPTKAGDAGAFGETLRRRHGWRLTPVPWCGDGFFVDAAQQSLGAAAEHLAGQFFVQDATSMLPGAVLRGALRSGDALLLDLCAAPGGKAAHLATFAGRGLVLAVDASEARCRALRANLVAVGADNVAVELGDGRLAGDRWPRRFDGVLVDAPCSGMGTVRKSRGVLRRWPGEFLPGAVALQGELLRSGWAALRPGGVLVYCTCSLTWEENEGVVEAFLREGEAEVEDLSWMPLALSPGGFIRVWPHLHDTDGFFLAALRKRGAPEGAPRGVPAADLERGAPCGAPAADLEPLPADQEAECRVAVRALLGVELPQAAGVLCSRRGARNAVFLAPRALDDLLLDGQPLWSVGVRVGHFVAKAGATARFLPCGELRVWAAGGPSAMLEPVALLTNRVVSQLEGDVGAYNALIDASAAEPKQGLAAAELWASRMGRARLCPDSVTYGALMKAAAREGSPASAEWWFGRMEAAGIPGDLVKHSILCDAFARAGDAAGAERWFLRLCARCAPNVVALASLLKAMVGGGDSRRVEAWLRRAAVAAVRPNAPCYLAALRTHAAAGDAAAAEATLARMRRDGLTPGAGALAAARQAVATVLPVMR